MGSLLFQGNFATGLDEPEAAAQVEPIRNDNSDAELASPPEWNSAESDDSGQLIGLSPRVVGSYTEYSGQQVDHSAPDISDYATARDGNQEIDNQVASSGTAAAREMAGQYGHGPITTEIGIEPLNPAQQYGNDYFKVPDPGANYLSGEYMQPMENDNWVQQVAQLNANSNSRAAFRSTQYASFFGGGDK